MKIAIGGKNIFLASNKAPMNGAYIINEALKSTKKIFR
jgi:hypothetical protein